MKLMGIVLATLSAFAIQANELGYEPHEVVQETDEFVVVHRHLGEFNVETMQAYQDAQYAQLGDLSDFSLTGFGDDSVEAISGTINLVLDKIEIIAKKIGGYIAGAIKVPTFEGQVFHALPNGVTDENMFEVAAGWKSPVAKCEEFAVYSKFIPGRWVARMDYVVMATPGGNINGKGQFLTNVHIQPASELQTRFGWGAELKVEAQRPFNKGTKEDPIAGLQLSLVHKVKSNMGSERLGATAYTIDGTGSITRVGATAGPQGKGTGEASEYCKNFRY